MQVHINCFVPVLSLVDDKVLDQWHLVKQVAAVFKPFMRMILKVCQKVSHIVGYILAVIGLIFLSILFILCGLAPTAIILWNLYGLLSYVFGLENILTITCWVPVVGIVVLLALFVIWKIMALVYEGLTKLWTEPCDIVILVCIVKLQGQSF